MVDSSNSLEQREPSHNHTGGQQDGSNGSMRGSGLQGKKSMLASIPVNCPAPTGQTCTLHIMLDTKVSVGSPGGGSFRSGPRSSFQFLIDGAPPTLGPTDALGNYVFAENVVTTGAQELEERQSYPASVITSAQSGNHTINVNLACIDLFDEGGCLVTAHWSTMRVDVFEP